MKYCVSARQPKEILNLADEIKIDYRDRKAFIDFIEDYPDKKFIFVIPTETVVEESDWEILEAYAQKVDLVIAIGSFFYLESCKIHHLKYYFNYPISTWFDLRGVVNLGVSEVVIAAPLIFEIDKIKSNIHIPVRVVPNVGFWGYIPRHDGICGEYIRPEDMKYYEDVITSLEFRADSLKQEAVLFKYYKDRYYPGNLKLLINNLIVNVDNRLFPEDFGLTRTNCHQICMEKPNSCHFCNSVFDLCNMVDKNGESLREQYTDDPKAPEDI